MPSPRTLQRLGLAALGVGSVISTFFRRAQIRAWAGIVLLLLTALAWNFAGSGRGSPSSELPFIFLAPIAMAYSFRANDVVSNRVVALAFLTGSIAIALLLLLRMTCMLYRKFQAFMVVF